MKASIIIPSFGRPSQLKRAILSAKNQTYQNTEILVVDDNGISTENSHETRAVVESCHCDKIKLFQHSINLGGSAARNTGLDNSEGHYVSFLDNDDEFEPDKIEKQIDCLNSSKNKSLGVIVHHSFWKNNQCVEVPRQPLLNNASAKIFSGELNLGIGSTFLCPKSLMQKINGFDNSFKRHQDLEMFLRFLDRFNFVFLPEPLTRIHIDDSSNIPQAKDLYKIKLQFFEKFKEKIEKMPDFEKHRFFKAHYFELTRIAIRNFDLPMAIFFFNKGKPDLVDLFTFVKECYKKARKNFHPRQPRASKK